MPGHMKRSHKRKSRRSRRTRKRRGGEFSWLHEKNAVMMHQNVMNNAANHFKKYKKAAMKQKDIASRCSQSIL